jgi:hypothetical protein
MDGNYFPVRVKMLNISLFSLSRINDYKMLFFQPVTEASYANIPIVAYCNIDSPTKVKHIYQNGCVILSGRI